MSKGKGDLSVMFEIANNAFIKKAITNESNYLGIITDEEIKSLDTENRWSLSTTLHRESISQHTFWVCFFCFIICKRAKVDDATMGKVLSYALFHDMDEIFTGDLNHKFKYDKENGLDLEKLKGYGKKKCWSKMQDFGVSQEEIDNQFNVDNYVKHIVKFADWLSATQFLVFEIKTGNRTDKVRLDFLYCLIGLQKVGSTLLQHISFSTSFDIANDLVALMRDIKEINEKIYGTDEEE